MNIGRRSQSAKLLAILSFQSCSTTSLLEIADNDVDGLSSIIPHYTYGIVQAIGGKVSSIGVDTVLVAETLYKFVIDSDHLRSSRLFNFVRTF